MKRTLLTLLLVFGLAAPASAAGAADPAAPPMARSMAAPSGEASASAERSWPLRGASWSAPRSNWVIKPFRTSTAAKAYFLPADVFFVGSQSAARALGMDRLLAVLNGLRPNGNDLGLGVIAGLIWAVVLRYLPVMVGFLYSFTKQMLWVLFRWGKAPGSRRVSPST